MESKSLNAFLQLSRSLHFSKTAQQLHMSPSTLSRIIQSLESEFGVTLFHRDNRSVELTQQGKVLQHYATNYFEDREKLNAQLVSGAGALSGEISIYCSVTAAHSFLHSVLKQFRLSYPKIEIVLHTGDTNDAVARVMEGKEDFAIAAKIDRENAALRFKLLGQTQLVMIGASNESYSSNILDSIWSKTPMILPERGVFRERVDEWFANINFSPNIYAQVGGNEAIVSMVSLGFGVGLVPKIVVDNSPLKEQVQVLALQPDTRSVEVGFYTKARRLTNPLINALWKTRTLTDEA